MHKLKRAIVNVLRSPIGIVSMVVLIVIVGLNSLLRLTDPLGIIRYQQELRALYLLALPHDTGYRLTPGTHNIGYQMVIGLDGLRIVPDADNRAVCTIAVLGDSVAFGMGVDDDEGIVNLLAREHPGVRWVNAALPGYSAANVSWQMNSINADGYLWLIIPNDDEPPRFYEYRKHLANPFALSRYLIALTESEPPPQDSAGFTTYADIILVRDNMLAFTFENQHLTDMIAVRYPSVIVAPMWTNNISAFDPHPNAQGHLEIAQVIRAYLPEFLERVCNA